MEEESRASPKYNRRKLLAGIGIAAAAAFGGAFINHVPKLVENVVNKITGKKNLWRIGFEGVVYAIAPDLVVDGTDDHIQLQQAVDALPAGGGKIIIYGGTYDVAVKLSRAINNIVFEGSGKATYLTNNGADNLIDAGAQTGWIVKDLRTDAGGLGGTWGTAATNLRKNVWVDTTYYNDSPTHLPLAGGTMTGDIAMGDKDITGACQITFTEEHANTSSSGAVTIDWAANGNKQKLTLEADTATTVAFTAPSGTGNLVLRIIQHASAGGTITWPGTVMWPDSTAPTLTDSASAIDIATFYCNGTNYYGMCNLAFGVPA